MMNERLYPTVEELEKQAEYLSRVPEPIYKLFVRWGIPEDVASRIKGGKIQEAIHE